MKFVKQLEQLTSSAENYIIKKVKETERIILFNLEEVDQEHIDDHYPEFPYFDKYDNMEYAAVIELRYTQWGTIEIIGILKKESFPKLIVVTLSDLPYEKIIFLAGHLEEY